MQPRAPHLGQRRAFARSFAAATLTFAALLCIGAPTSALSNPTGETTPAIGFQRIEFSYNDCDAPYCTGYGSRAVVMNVFYPADTDELEKEDDSRDRGFSFCDPAPEVYVKDNGPKELAWLMCTADFYRQTAIEGAPIAEPDGLLGSKYPVIFFSSGLRFYTHGYDRLLRGLVDAGFAVVALSHPKLDHVVRLDDGREIFGPKFSNHFAEVKVYAQDAQEAITELGALNDELFDGLLKVEGVGYMGHSIGGAAATLAANQDDRIDAALNLDGTTVLSDRLFFPRDTIRVARGLTKPWMMISSNNNWLGHYLNGLEDHRTMPVGYGFRIKGSVHTDFLDVCGPGPYRWEWREAKRCGSIGPHAFVDIVLDYADAFFAQHLVGVEQPLLQLGAPRHPAVRDFHRWECDGNAYDCQK